MVFCSFLIDGICRGYTFMTTHELKPWFFFAVKPRDTRSDKLDENSRMWQVGWKIVVAILVCKYAKIDIVNDTEVIKIIEK